MIVREEIVQRLGVGGCPGRGIMRRDARGWGQPRHELSHLYQARGVVLARIMCDPTHLGMHRRAA